MDSPFLNTISDGLATHAHLVARFEFNYMAQRREDGVKRPPSPQRMLVAEWNAIITELRESYPGSRLVIGGKSMGGRIASMVADEQKVAGLVCLGYPFHPPGKPERLRTAHLGSIATPTLIVQGTRDQFGTRDEVTSYELAKQISFHWAEDGDHNLKPRKSSGRSEDQNIGEAIAKVSNFLSTLEDEGQVK